MNYIDTNRNITIDIFKVICLFLIILAHVNIPDIISEVRSFDVIGLVLASSLFLHQFENMSIYRDKVKKRFLRLLGPTYFTITFILVGTYFLCKVYNIPYIYNFKDIILSYLLIDGIGYVWIARIFIIIFLLSPLLFYTLRYKDNLYFTFTLIVLFLLKVLYELISCCKINSLFYYFIYYGLIYSISYLIIASYGINLKYRRISNKKCRKYAIALVLCFILYKILCYSFFSDPLFKLEKHPPMLDWIIYGVLVSFLLIYAIDKKSYSFSKINAKTIIWISSNSFTIYYVHVVIIKIIEFYTGNLNFIRLNWFIEYLIILGISLLITIILNSVKRIILK